MRMHHLFIGAAFALPFCANAECGAQSGAERPQLLELYTSEGCNSCPPAEEWLNRLQAGARVVPLAFHVDYWDSARWRDRFAQPGFAARQRAIAARSKSQTYTPQIVLDGRIWADWHRGGAMAAQATPTAFKLDVHRDDLSVHWRSEFASATEAGRNRLFVALVEDGLQSQVRAGENAGKTLRHDHVVQAFSGPNPAAMGSTRLRARSDVDPAHSRIVAWIEDTRSGSVAQVLQVALADCEASPK
jgi:hypothetical protein